MVTLTIVPPAKTVPQNNATAVICSVCPMAASRQMATIANSAVMAGATRLAWARRDAGLTAVLFRGVATGFISHDFARADVIPTRHRGVLGRTLRLQARVRPSGLPFCVPGPRWSGGEVRALALTATPREEIHDEELQQQLTVNALLRILHPPLVGKPIRHP